MKQPNLLFESFFFCNGNLPICNIKHLYNLKLFLSTIRGFCFPFIQHCKHSSIMQRVTAYPAKTSQCHRRFIVGRDEPNGNAEKC